MRRLQQLLKFRLGRIVHRLSRPLDDRTARACSRAEDVDDGARVLRANRDPGAALELVPDLSHLGEVLRARDVGQVLARSVQHVAGGYHMAGYLG